MSKMHFGVGKLVQLCYNDSSSVHSIYGNTAQNPPDGFTHNLLAVLPLGNTAQRASGDFAFIFF